MADYGTLEASVESSRPVEVYTFALGATSYLYTSAEDEITVGATTWNPENISRGPLAQGEDDRDAALELVMDAQNTFVRQYIEIVPGQRASLSIFRLQRDETPSLTTRLIYKGFVQSVNFSDNGLKAKVATRSIEGTLSRQIPRMTYQSPCNHFLYDSFCGVDPDSFKHTGEVTSVSGNTLTVSGASGFADGHFEGGYIKPAGFQDFRMVLNHTGNDLTVMLPFHSNLTGFNVDVFAGCDHALAGHCNTRFNNVGRHGGFAWVPTKNPFNTGLVP